MKTQQTFIGGVATLIYYIVGFIVMLIMGITFASSLSLFYDGDGYISILQYIADNNYLRINLFIVSLALLGFSYFLTKNINKFVVNYYIDKQFNPSTPLSINLTITIEELKDAKVGSYSTYNFSIDNTNYNLAGANNLYLDMSVVDGKYLPLPKSNSNMTSENRIEVDNFYYNFCSQELYFFYIDSFIFKNKYLFNKNTKQIIRIKSEHFKTPILTILISILGFIFFCSSLLFYVCFFTNHPNFLPVALLLSGMLVGGFFFFKSSYEDDIAIEYLLKHLDKI